MNLIRAYEEFLIPATNLPKVHHNKTIKHMWHREASEKYEQMIARKIINCKIEGTTESIMTKNKASNCHLMHMKTDNKKKRKRRNDYGLKCKK